MRAIGKVGILSIAMWQLLALRCAYDASAFFKDLKMTAGVIAHKSRPLICVRLNIYSRLMALMSEPKM